MVSYKVVETEIIFLTCIVSPKQMGIEEEAKERWKHSGRSGHRKILYDTRINCIQIWISGNEHTVWYDVVVDHQKFVLLMSRIRALCWMRCPSLAKP